MKQNLDRQKLKIGILNNGSIPTSTFTPKGLAFDNGKDYTDLTEGMGYEYNEEQAKELGINLV